MSYTQRYLDDDDDDVDIAELIKPRRKSTADATARIKRWVFNKIKTFKCLLKVFLDSFRFLLIVNLASRLSDVNRDGAILENLVLEYH